MTNHKQAAPSNLQPILQKSGLRNWALFLFVRFASKRERGSEFLSDPIILRDKDQLLKPEDPGKRDDDEDEVIQRFESFTSFNNWVGLTTENYTQSLHLAAGETSTKRESGNVPHEAITWAFTHSGLAALGVDPKTLASFPAPFREGMAARAEMLGDTGRRAPENWHGRLGSKDIHALLIVSGRELEAFAGDLKSLKVRRDLRELVKNHTAWANSKSEKDAAGAENTENTNDQLTPTQEIFSFLKEQLGREEPSLDDNAVQLMHVEFGEDPYRTGSDQSDAGEANPIQKRVEHFGFRDGLSQPFFFTDDKPKKPSKGGGRPVSDGTWAPVADGELLLGQIDEDGKTASVPVNPTLRDMGSYLVLRKLEQDVTGFRRFCERISEQRDNSDSPDAIAARMMGRWRNGAPLTDWPDHPEGYDDEDWATLNDFRYSNDPHGLKCPIGAHVRRLNPRDHANGEAARRHRILRRSISYGGSLIEDVETADSEPRGMLFMALMSRIDLQFELLQRDWLNTGELFSQVGAGRCPISGNHTGAAGDTFHDGRSAKPIAPLQAFVTLRGGDYFFVPSREAMAELLGSEDGNRFPPEARGIKVRANSVNTPGLFDPVRLTEFGRAILAAKKGSPKPPAKPEDLFHPTVKRLRLSERARDGGAPNSGHIVFAGRYCDVTEMQETPEIFTEHHYNQIGLELGGEKVIIGEPRDSATRKARLTRLHAAYYTLGQKYRKKATDPSIRDAILSKNFEDLSKDEKSAFDVAAAAVVGAMTKVARMGLHSISARVGPSGVVDLLQDKGFAIPYAIASRIYGLPGPDYVTPIAVASQYAKFDLMEVPPSWLSAGQSIPANIAGYLTMQTWTRFAFAEVFTNLQRLSELTAVSRKAYSEFKQHIMQLMERMRRYPPSEPTLLSELVSQSNLVVNEKGVVEATDNPDLIRENLDHARLALTDIMGAHMVNIGPPFGKIMELLLDQPVSVDEFIGLHVGEEPGKPGPEHQAFRQKYNRFIDECLRFRPAGEVQFRTVRAPKEALEADPNWLYKLPSGAAVRDGDRIAMMINTANMDEEFELPGGGRESRAYFSLARDRGLYIGFGGRPLSDRSERSPHFCWGEQIGRLVLRELLQSVRRFEDLRRVPGPDGDLKRSVGLAFSLKARFKPEN